MSGALCRLSVQTGTDHTVDLVLPSTPSIAALVPAIADLTGVPPGAWYLCRLDGRRLDESMSLVQNRIYDGDQLALIARDVPELPPRRQDAFDLAATIDPTPPDTSSPPAPVLFFCSVTLAAVLACLHGGAASGAVAAALCCAIVLLTARMIGPAAELTSHALACAAIPLGAAAGFLAVPSVPAAPNVLLASAAAGTVAWLVCRMHPQGLVVCAATLGVCVPLGLAATAATVQHLPIATVGAAVSALALTAVTVAPRLALLGTGSGPDTVESHRVARTHRVLTGLVMGSSTAAAVGGIVMAFDTGRDTFVLGALVAALLLARSFSYRDTMRCWFTAANGIFCAAVTLAASALRFPQWSPWLALSTLCIGVALLRIGAATPRSRRLMAHLDAALLVAVVPAALWVADVYAMVRGR